MENKHGKPGGGAAHDDDDDQKVAAIAVVVDGEKKMPAKVTPRQTTLRSWRCSYADAFLARCSPVDPENFSLGYGTYLSPWMKQEPMEEKYYECGNNGFGNPQGNYFECYICGEHVREHLKGQHERNYGKCEENNVERSVELWGKPRKERYQLRWKEVPKPAEDEDEPKDIDYWATRCRIRSLPMFDVKNSRRPEMACTEAYDKQEGKRALDFGSHSFQASLLPSDSNAFPGWLSCAIQTTWAPVKDLVGTYEYGNDIERMVLNYTKDAVWMYNQKTYRDSDDDDDSYFEGKDENDAAFWDDYGNSEWRPFPPFYAVPAEGVNPTILRNAKSLDMKHHGGANSDVWSLQNYELVPRLKPLLEDLAASTNDRPIPKYQMIIDPNQFVRPRKSDKAKVWVPCEFDISPDGKKASLVGGDRAHWMEASTIDKVATPVLSAALPLLAKLTKPYMLLEGQRLQVVVKAQSIIVPPKQELDTKPENKPEYLGLWHVDGHHEPVAAVVLYYYDVDDALEGGNMELMDRRPITVLGYGDTCRNSDHFPAEKLREALRQSEEAIANGDSAPVPNCSVPIKTGTLLVFSNYQMAHRVLKMVNTSEERAASRNFVALFVMDPAAERLVPARAHLVSPYLFMRALTGKCGLLPCSASNNSLPDAAAQLIMEFIGAVPSVMERRRIRNDLLRMQLKPKEYLGASQTMVCGTGNGCHTMLGMFDDHLKNDERTRDMYDPFAKAEARINALNFPPKTLGRGLSETLSTLSEDLNDPAYGDTVDVRMQQLNADMDRQTEALMSSEKKTAPAASEPVSETVRHEDPDDDEDVDSNEETEEETSSAGYEPVPESEAGASGWDWMRVLGFLTLESIRKVNTVVIPRLFSLESLLLVEIKLLK